MEPAVWHLNEGHSAFLLAERVRELVSAGSELDPALGVGRNYVSSQITKGQQFNNVEGYSNPEIDKLFAEGAVATPDSRRKELYEKAQKILVEDVPVAWMLELQFPTIMRCKVKNLITTGIGVNDGFKDAWLDK